MKQGGRQALPAIAGALARGLLVLCALGSLTAPLSRLVPAEGATARQLQWLLELAAHWQWLYLLLGAVALALLLWMQRGWWLLCPIAVLAMSFGLQSAALERQAGPAGASAAGVLVVGTANLAVGTTDFGALLGWLQSADAPDVLFLQEFTDAAQHALTVPGVAQRYPYRVEAPQPDPFGLAVLSRLPLSDVQRLTPASALATLRLRATLTLPDGHAVRLAAVHPMPPLNAAYARARDDALAEEARHLAQPGALGLMGGDFNTTPWARGMFAVQGQLRRSGAVPSWPNAWGWLSVLPLDHVLATSGWQLVESRPGPNCGVRPPAGGGAIEVRKQSVMEDVFGLQRLCSKR